MTRFTGGPAQQQTFPLHRYCLDSQPLVKLVFSLNLCSTNIPLKLHLSDNLDKEPKNQAESGDGIEGHCHRLQGPREGKLQNLKLTTLQKSPEN